ncbi:acyltransferase family protein [Herbaspirillum sp. alder98]|uniref:acyltransferase family protein n=1 Tax=Herbaspirillum sp. alder98 TaxID=2913096 RepID=UPI001CD839C7|nr:acyltransferase family protein [Herbaspirillum sp. alder98]MCA1322638.1 acyltransferase [Herbaspirillum sp. alder98]
MKIHYRREIDGLRAVAVVAVVLFHAGFDAFSGGYTGVDIFFVISGFLISLILIKELDTGTFSIVSFYERRARRIMPALLLVMLACLPFAWFLLSPPDMKGFAQNVVAVMLFASNIFFWRSAGYFDSDSDLKPLLHTWSLSVEEQFYIFFPLILWLCWRYARRATPLILTVILLASLWAAHKMAPVAAGANFFLLPTRAWELLIGTLCAMHVSRKNYVTPTGMVPEIGSLVGLAAIVYSIFAFDKNTPFPSFYALVPTVGAALIILLATQQTITGRYILGNRPTVLIGLISYSAYLWHQPLFAFARYDSANGLTAWQLCALAVIAFVLGYFTWKYVEAPFRSKSTVTRKQIFSFAALASSLFLAVGLAGHVSKGFVMRMDPTAVAYLDKFDLRYPTWSYYKTSDWFNNFRIECDYYDVPKQWSGNSTQMPKQISSSCHTRDAQKSHAIFLWGDSHAQQFYSGLKKNLPQSWQILQIASSGCRPMLVMADSADNYCTHSNFHALQSIGANHPEVVLIAQEQGHDIAHMQKMAEALKALGVRKVLFAGPTPHWQKGGLPTLIATRFWGHVPDHTFYGLNMKVKGIDDRFKADFHNAPQAEYVSLFDHFCNAAGCQTIVNGSIDNVTTYDYGHLAAIASDSIARSALVPKILETEAAQTSTAIVTHFNPNTSASNS